jgi:hypothetical protein
MAAMVAMVVPAVKDPYTAGPARRRKAAAAAAAAMAAAEATAVMEKTSTLPSAKRRPTPIF